MPNLRKHNLPMKLQSYEIDFSNIFEEKSNDSNSQCSKCYADSGNENKGKIPVKLYCSRHCSSTVITKFSCTIEGCKKVFRSQDCLDRHCLFHEGKKPYTCSECQYGFSTFVALKEHQFKHSNEKPYGCPFCDRFFRHVSALHRHKTIHFGKLSKKYSCEYCEKTFTHSSYLKSHKLVHTQERKYPCSQCSKRFLHSSDLKRHVRVHSGVKPYSCSVCSGRFTDISNLRRHLKEHQNKHFQCDKCNKSFKNEAQLKIHKKKKHIKDGINLETKLSLSITNPSENSSVATNLVEPPLNSEIDNNAKVNEPYISEYDHVAFVEFPDFKNLEYYNFLKIFTSTCDKLAAPVDVNLMRKITLVHKTVVDEISNPSSLTIIKPNVTHLYNTIQILEKVMADNMKYILKSINL